MESRAKFLGHPIHPMLIVFPLGLFITSVIFDVIYLANGNTTLPTISYYNILAGIGFGLLAAIFGFRDWLAIPAGTRAKEVGGMHGIGNVVVVLLMGLSWLIRANSANFIPSTLGFILSFAGVGLGAVTAWLGGELVDRLGVGVDRGAHLDAPSSLSGQPAHEHVMGNTMSAVPVTGQEKYEEKHIEKHDDAEFIPPGTTTLTDELERRETDNLD